MTPISDTITVTPEGRTVVDMRKLFAKKHIQDIAASSPHVDYL